MTGAIAYHWRMVKKALSTQVSRAAAVPDELSGFRLDQAAARMFPDYSRARLQDWIKAGNLTVNQQPARVRDKVYSADQLQLRAEIQAVETWIAEPQALDIVHEDQDLLVINKGMDTVVHPAAGHSSGTLLNGLLFHSPPLKLLPRAGIVHRLDKDTTGLMVVAKTVRAHTQQVRQLQRLDIWREYEAVVQGVLTAGGTVDAPLGRHPVNRKRRAVVADGQQAITHYTVIRRFRSHTHLRVRLETGRTHQIRVHLTHLGHPIVGDKTYGGRLQIPRDCSAALESALRAMGRQALHARRLSLVHPVSGEALAWESPLPRDMVDLLQALDTDLQQS